MSLLLEMLIKYLAVKGNHIFKVLSKGSEQQQKKRDRVKDKAYVIKHEHLDNLGEG